MLRDEKVQRQRRTPGVGTRDARREACGHDRHTLLAFLDRIDTILDREGTERALRELRAHAISILRIGSGSGRGGADGHDAVLDPGPDGRREWSPR